MVKRIAMLLGLILLVSSIPAWSAERGFSWTNAPARGDHIGVNLNPYSLGKYLEQCQVNRPEIVGEIKLLLEKGEYYRKRTKDQKGKSTVLTVYIDPDYMLHIITYRNETCPVCNGTGSRPLPVDAISSHVNLGLRCIECKGEGVLKNQTTEKYFTLSSEDFENPEEGREIMRHKAYSSAPQGAEQWVERLSSQNPKERLDACLWLDQNYVRNGMFFQDIMPMLKKARYHDSDAKKRIMVWQFWAGKDMPNERKRAYYRIYADTKTGKITRKGFYAGR